MESVLWVDTGKCTGCRVCQLVCSMEKTGEYNPERSHIKIIRNADLDVNIPVTKVSCDLCGKCVDWCFEKAIKIISLKEAIILRKEVRMGAFPAPLIE